MIRCTRLTMSILAIALAAALPAFADEPTGSKEAVNEPRQSEVPSEVPPPFERKRYGGAAVVTDLLGLLAQGFGASIGGKTEGGWGTVALESGRAFAIAGTLTSVSGAVVVHSSRSSTRTLLSLGLRVGVPAACMTVGYAASSPSKDGYTPVLLSSLLVGSLVAAIVDHAVLMRTSPSDSANAVRKKEQGATWSPYVSPMLGGAGVGFSGTM